MVSPKQAVWWAALAIIYAILAGLSSSRTSLWVDELHSQWVISGSIEQIIPRAAAGNQSPLYFFGLYPCYRTLTGLGVYPELALRLPSIALWCTLIALACGSARGLRWSQASLILVAGVLSLDHIQLFYGTEARVYVGLQVVGLVGWIAVLKVSGCMPGQLQRSGAEAPTRATEPVPQATAPVAQANRNQSVQCNPSARRATGWLILWAMCGSLLVWLHLTSCFVVATQWLVGGGLLLSREACREQSPRRWALWYFLAGVGVAAVGFAAIALDPALWDRRSNWAAFAGEPSFSALWALFPFTPLLLPVAGGVLLDRLLSWAFPQPAALNPPQPVHSQPQIHRYVILWFLASCLPVLAIWLLTWLDIAPLMHRRYAVGVLVPLVMLSGSLLQYVSRWWLQAVVVVVVLASLMMQQGTVGVWASGRLAPWQRLEGWRQASRYIEEDASTQSPALDQQVWCASGLVEGLAASLPLATEQDVYLSYPLRGLYSLDVTPPVALHALVNNPNRWAEQITQAGAPSRIVWIVYRGSGARLQTHVQRLIAGCAARGWTLKSETEPREFGQVSVIKLRRD